MDIQQIPQADLLDILFEGRNKDYGAYDLRKSYNRRLGLSIAGMLALCLLLFIGLTVAGESGHPRLPITVTDVPLTPVEPMAIKKELPIPKPVPLSAPPAPTIRVVTTRIVPDDQVRPDDKPQPDVVPDNFKIDVNTDLTAHGADVVRPLGEGNGPGSNVINAPVKPDAADDDNIFRKVEIESTYRGGMAAWQRFLLKNFRVPDADDAESGDATVVVQFIVDKEGNVSDVEALSGPAGLQKEAVRVIRLSGKWEPAIQNGRPVRSYKKQPITIHLAS